MGYQPIDIDNTGHATFVLPALEEIAVRATAGRDGGFVISARGLCAYPTHAWLAALVEKIGAALAEADDLDWHGAP